MKPLITADYARDGPGGESDTTDSPTRKSPMDELIPVSYKKRTTQEAVTEWVLFLNAITVSPPITALVFRPIK